MAESITLKAQCHCAFASYSYTLPKSAFPLKSAICHCESCRHVSGHIFATYAVIPSPQRPDVSKLAGYAYSSGLTRYFCPKCGASMINFEESEWEFATGILTVEGRPEAGALEGLLNRVQLWVSDSGDGGCSIWMPGEWQGKRYLYGRGSEEVNDQMLQDMVSQASENTSIGGNLGTSNHPSSSVSDVLEACCHCGKVKIAIARQDDGSKYRAGIDACISCRKVSGFEITSWATLDPAKVSINGNGLDLQSPTMGHYKTSVDVHRYFCKTCSATIFYLKDGKVKNPGIDLGVGLLSGHGARAEKWLDWTKYEEYVAYSEEANDRPFVQSLIEGVTRSRRDGLEKDKSL